MLNGKEAKLYEDPKKNEKVTTSDNGATKTQQQESKTASQKIEKSDFDRKLDQQKATKRKRCRSPSTELPRKRRKQESGDESDSRFEIGENFYTPKRKKVREGLRPIFIDGSNVAYSHGNNRYFSVRGLKMCIDFFRKRGHAVKAFVPQFRLKKHQTDNHALLKRLVDRKLVVVTPSLTIRNRIRTPYDDWYIVQAAAIEGGVIVSRDGFRDIVRRRPSLRPVVEERRLVPTWVHDTLLFPMDPHGNRRCDLNAFLRF